ncbi:MAG TPA: CHAT domain-containing protein [Thermoanaerobaculia bacterium]|nr:CHAT domain-containing protein [Thermoanaerobaculia bacterium]
MTAQHLDALTVAMLAEGRVRRQDLPPLLAHLEQCRRCSDALEIANEVAAEQGGGAVRRAPRTWLMAIAAVLAAIVIAVPLMRQRDRGIAQLVELAPRSARVVAPRITGGFDWAAYRGPMRATGSSDTETTRLRLGGAAADAIDRADRERTPAAEHEAAVALLLIEKPLEAEARLVRALKENDKEAKLWSDLAAARCAAADQLGKPSLLPRALAAADRAVELDPRLPEALFNRALIVERMGLTAEARAAWQAYLGVDPSSAWANEAREHLKALPSETTTHSQFEKERPKLERAAESGDAATVAAIVAAHPQNARAWGETIYLGQWALAEHEHRDAEAQRMLAVARAIGHALAARSGESLLRDSVRAIDDAGGPRAEGRGPRETAVAPLALGPQPSALLPQPSALRRLAEAHRLYFTGRRTYNQQKPAEAERELRAAAERFGAAPMALAARYFAANTRYDQGGVSRAREELAALLASTPEKYAALRAQIRWQHALCFMVDGDWDGALPLLSGASSEFRRLGERGHAAFLDTLLADALASLGREDEAWTARIRAFTALSAEGLGDRLPVSLGAAARMELRGGDREAALPLLRLEEAATRRENRDTLLADALVRIAVLRGELGDGIAAMDAVREADVVASRIGDEALRGRARADVQFATASVLARSDPRRARELLGSAIDAYRSFELPVFLPEAYLVRARASMAVDDRTAAARDLDDGLAALERHRVQVTDAIVGTGVLDAGKALVADAIRLSLDRGDVRAALAYAERSRARRKEGDFDLATLQAALGKTVVLELVVLPEEVIAFAITRHGVTLARENVTRDVVAAKVARGDAGELYDLLIRPSAAALETARGLIVVADPLVAAVPFAALYDRTAKRHLVERLAVASAPSAAALRPTDTTVPRSLLAIALPSGAQESRALPESTREVGELTSLYAHAVTPAEATFASFASAAPSADVVHIAGHTARERGAGDAALVFANGERVSWQTIATSRFAPGAIVFLAACETLRPSSAARALSLGDGVLAAGAAEVIGTLTPIPDRDAREIFHSVHQHIARGAGAAEALRRAQLEALQNESAGRAGNAWRSVTLLTTRVPG